MGDAVVAVCPGLRSQVVPSIVTLVPGTTVSRSTSAHVEPVLVKT